MGTYVEAAAQDSERLAAGRAWVRWGMAAAVTGMLAWLVGFALIPVVRCPIVVSRYGSTDRDLRLPHLPAGPDNAGAGRARAGAM